MIIVASVSCIYSLGDPIDYRSMVISLRPGMQMERDELCQKLVTLQYERNDVNFVRNKFRVHGDIVDIYLAYMSELAIRVEFFGDEIDRITEFNPLTGAKQNVVKHVAIFPASHYIVSAEKKAAALEKIRAECDAQVKQFTAEGKLIEAQRIAQRTNYDMEMLNEVGMCKGIENYSAVLSGRAPGSRCPPLCWIISRMIFCCLWTRAMLPCRRCAPCTAATMPAKKRWWSMASACRPPSITARSSSRKWSPS